MKRAIGTVLATLAVALAGCGDDDGEDVLDAPPPIDAPDQPLPDAPPVGCQVPPGVAYIISALSIMDQGEGMDITGDGVPDNNLYFMGLLANDGWQESIASGNAIYIYQMGDWVEPLTPTFADMRMYFYHGVDADDPEDPSNNVAGEGQFYVPAEQLDVSCRPTSEWDDCSITDRVVDARTPTWTFYEPTVGSIEFTEARFVATISEDYQTLDGRFGAVWTACGLSNSPMPGSTSGTILELMGAMYPDSQPDFDRDGDGMETIVADMSGVRECHDGPNATVPNDIIVGPDCPCDPRIADGYTVAMRGTAVRAELVGVTAAQ